MQKSGETNPSFTRDGYVIYLPITHSTGGQYKSSLLKMNRRTAEDREEKNFFFENAGHVIYQERFDQFIDLVQQFLQEH